MSVTPIARKLEEKENLDKRPLKKVATSNIPITTLQQVAPPPQVRRFSVTLPVSSKRTREINHHLNDPAKIFEATLQNESIAKAQDLLFANISECLPVLLEKIYILSSDPIPNPLLDSHLKLLGYLKNYPHQRDYLEIIVRWMEKIYSDLKVERALVVCLQLIYPSKEEYSKDWQIYSRILQLCAKLAYDNRSIPPYTHEPSELLQHLREGKIDLALILVRRFNSQRALFMLYAMMERSLEAPGQAEFFGNCYETWFKTTNEEEIIVFKTVGHPKHGSLLQSIMEKAYNCPNVSDVQIVFEGLSKPSLHANSRILSLYSEPLGQAFIFQREQNKSNILTLTECDKRIPLVMQYIYLDNIQMTHSIAYELVHSADTWLITKLTHDIQSFLLSSHPRRQFANILTLANSLKLRDPFKNRWSDLQDNIIHAIFGISNRPIYFSQAPWEEFLITFGSLIEQLNFDQELINSREQRFNAALDLAIKYCPNVQEITLPRNTNDGHIKKVASFSKLSKLTISPSLLLTPLGMTQLKRTSVTELKLKSFENLFRQGGLDWLPLLTQLISLDVNTELCDQYLSLHATAWLPNLVKLKVNFPTADWFELRLLKNHRKLQILLITFDEPQPSSEFMKNLYKDNDELTQIFEADRQTYKVEVDHFAHPDRGLNHMLKQVIPAQKGLEHLSLNFDFNAQTILDASFVRSVILCPSLLFLGLQSRYSIPETTKNMVSKCNKDWELKRKGKNLTSI